jgi:hypothetical protein
MGILQLKITLTLINDIMPYCRIFVFGTVFDKISPCV